ncbi:hypothetical protein [Corynebacterium poyangense]|nr:hypothetical protein [Corynebacterium poyangense]
MAKFIVGGMDTTTPDHPRVMARVIGTLLIAEGQRLGLMLGA